MWTWEIWFCPSSAIYWHGEGETTNPPPLHACGFWESRPSQEQKNCPCPSQAIELRRVFLHIEIPPYWRYTKAKPGELIKIASIWKTLVNYKCPVLLWCHTCLVAMGNGSLPLLIQQNLVDDTMQDLWLVLMYGLRIEQLWAVLQWGQIIISHFHVMLTSHYFWANKKSAFYMLWVT